MIQATVKNRIEFPKISLQSDLEVIAKDIIIKDMINRIKQHKAIDGGALPENAESTKKRKGHGDQLQDTGLLLKSFVYFKEGKDTVRITINEDRYLEGTYLQGGIRTNNGYKRYKFFGVSIFAERKAISYMKNRIKELIKK